MLELRKSDSQNIHTLLEIDKDGNERVIATIPDLDGLKKIDLSKVKIVEESETRE